MLWEVSGSETIRSRPQAFISAFVRRIEGGLLRGAPVRSRYVVTRQTADALEFRAVNWLTAFNVGLNEVSLAIAPDGRLQFAIRYPRWAGYSLALGAVLGIGFIAMLLALGIHERLVWAMALFWGFVFPWLLILIHRGPVRGLMKRLIAEVDSAALL